MIVVAAWVAAFGIVITSAQGVKTMRDDSAIFTLMLHAEDRRPPTRAGAAPLLRGLESDAAGVQDAALLGLGRLENPELVPDIAKMLESPVPAVRSQAANALAQAVTNGDARLASEPLRARARVEKDDAVRGAIARSLGRLPYRTVAEVREAEDAIVALSWKTSGGASGTSDGRAQGAASATAATAKDDTASNGVTSAREDSDATTLFGVAHGLASLTRKSARFMSAPPAAQRQAADPARAASQAAAPKAPGDVRAGSRGRASQGVTPQSAASQTTDDVRAASRGGASQGVTPQGAATPSAASQAAGSAAAPEAPAARADVMAGASAPAPSLFSFETLARLRQLARHGVKADSTEAMHTADPREANRRVRRLALMALASAKDVDVPLLEGTISDPDDQVRRLTVLASIANGPAPIAAQLAERARHDASFNVRYEALRVHARMRANANANANANGNGNGNGNGNANANANANVNGNANANATANAQAPANAGASATASSLASPASSPSSSCQPELDALADANPHVVLLAIDLLADCAGEPIGQPSVAVPVADRLTAIVDERAKSRGAGDWHRPAHALVSLARVAPDRAAARLMRFVEDETWEVRAYAAKAAGALGDRARLDLLAQDAQDNVRNAALDALRPLAGHEADRIYLAQITRPDYQLVRTAAMALKDTPLKPETTIAAFDALARITAERKDTSRDPRMALLDTLATTGAQMDAAPSRLQPYLSDFDPAIAERAASILSTWTNQPQKATPHRLIPVAPPTWKALHAEQQRGVTAIVHMSSGRAFTIALFPLDAPTNVMRFIHQTRAGDFNGLSFHRVEPNFVIQGGSPHANEYTGDARFTRDEVTMRPQVRGTVGISTRGHDTGDGQIYVNLVDNYRLDHSYTIIGAVTDGMDTVDAVQEGDVIERIDLRTAATPR